MAVQDPEVTRFLNEAARPVAEKLRDLRAELAALDVRWQQIQGDIPNTSEEIDDGRASEGVRQLLGSEVHDLFYAVGVLNGHLQELPAATLEKVCVRPFWV